MKRKTQTSSFGSVLRQSHDSKKFYNLKMCEKFNNCETINFNELKIRNENLNKFYCKSSENKLLMLCFSSEVLLNLI